MGRKAASTSAVLDRSSLRGPRHLARPARTADRGHAAHAGRRRGAQSGGRGQLFGPAGRKATNNSNPKVNVDLPEFPAVLDRELDAIEAYLATSLDEVLGSMGEDTAKPSRNRVGESSYRCNNQPIKKA